MRYILLNLEAPLMAFGGETVDNYGVVRPFPAASMLTGLLANALGWRRVERARHQRLQDRLAFAARIDREPAGGVHMTDFQSAAITNTDRSWTTRGRPEGRGGGVYVNWLRYRDYFADMRVRAALRLEPAGEWPTLDDAAAALREPARPLFIGRKPCLPSAPLFAGFVDGDTALDAIIAAPMDAADRAGAAAVRLQWPGGESGGGADGVTQSREYMITDERNWVSGLYGGGRLVGEGTMPADRFAVAAPDAPDADAGGDGDAPAAIDAAAATPDAAGAPEEGTR